jgi:hypothetical protein
MTPLASRAGAESLPDVDVNDLLLTPIRRYTV